VFVCSPIIFEVLYGGNHDLPTQLDGLASGVYSWSLYAHLRQQCHNSKLVTFQKRLLKVLKCYDFLWVQRRHSCSPAGSFTNCVMTLYLLKVNLQTFLSIPITPKRQILICDTCCKRTISIRECHIMDVRFSVVTDILLLEVKVMLSLWPSRRHVGRVEE